MKRILSVMLSALLALSAFAPLQVSAADLPDTSVVMDQTDGEVEGGNQDDSSEDPDDGESDQGTDGESTDDNLDDDAENPGEDPSSEDPDDGEPSEGEDDLDEEEDASSNKIEITSDMLIYDRDQNTGEGIPDRLFDGVIEDNSNIGWCDWESVNTITVDLGKHYAIERMDVYTMSWNPDGEKPIEIWAGPYEDEMVKVLTCPGTAADEMKTFDVSTECMAVRYLTIRIAGSWRELELFGEEVEAPEPYPDDPQIVISENMLTYDAAGATESTPDKLFDGSLSVPDGAWSSWGTGRTIVVDLGEEYDITKFVLHNTGWNFNGTDYANLIISAGKTVEDAMEVVTGGLGADETETFQVMGDCDGVRYLVVEASQGGYFTELEVFGTKSSGAPSAELINVTEDMIIQGLVDSPDNATRLFDGDPGWGAAWETNSWNSWTGTSILVDLGEEYDLSRLVFYKVDWQKDNSMSIQVGATTDDLMEICSFLCEGDTNSYSESYNCAEDAKGVRYLKIDTASGGYFGELEIYGVKSSEASATGKINVTSDMVIYEGDGGAYPPENMFDGILPPYDGGDQDWETGCWNAYGAINTFLVDLGQEYDITEMIYYGYYWSDSYPLTVSVGNDPDDLMEAWVHRGGPNGGGDIVEGDAESGLKVTYDTSDSCQGVRYLQVSVDVGYFKELELYGRPSSGSSGNGSIVITPDMVIGTADDSFYDMFDGDRQTKWNVTGETSVLVDLGGLYQMRKINVYRPLYAKGSFIVEGGKTADNMKVLAESADMLYFSNWVQMDAPGLVRYLRITAPTGGWAELQLLGKEADGSYSLNPVTNFSAANAEEAGAVAVDVEWTVPTVSGMDTVVPDGFELRYSTEEITEENFAEAALVEGVAAPAEPGQKMSVTVTGLAEDTKYYFAIKAVDYSDPFLYSAMKTAEVTTGADAEAPAVVEDLTAVAGANLVKLSWTAVGNDGTSGTAASYRLLYSLREITEDDIANGADDVFEAADMIDPSAAGTAERYTLKGLEAETTYYLALVVADEKGQQSVARLIVETRPATGAPDAITDLAAAAGETVDEVKLTFTGVGDDYDIRYSTEPITEENFAGAPAAEFVLTDDGAILSGFAAAGTYYFAVKAINIDGEASAISNIAQLDKSGIIEIDESMLIEEFPLGDPMQLFDEMGAVLDGSAPSTQYNPGSMFSEEVTNIIIDLMGEYALSELRFFDGASTGAMNIYTGEPFSWDLSGTTSLDKTNEWNSVSLDVTTRYIKIDFSTLDIIPNEIALIGAQQSEVEIPEKTEHELKTMDQLIGTNAFIDDFTDNLMAYGNIREYHNFDWTWNATAAAAGFNPSANDGRWDFDAYYKKLHDAGIRVNVAVQGWQKTDESVDWDDPLSYTEYAASMYQYAARYGSTVVDESMLNLLPDNEPLTGLGYVPILEFGNEQDNDWTGRMGHFNTFENAAFQSAAYDGHEGKMGPGYGAKAADPNMLISIGGLARPDLKVFKALNFWSEFNRDDQQMPIDIYNVHFYSNTSTSGVDSSRSTGVSPEDGQTIQILKEIIDYRDRYAPDVEIFLSEFGWDTNPESPNAALANDNYTAREVQAQWILRMYLLLSAIGVDQAQQFMIRDTGPEDSTGGLYGTSGMVTLPDPANGKYLEEKKDSWYYTYTLRNRMEGYRFVQEIDSGNENVMLYEYQNDNGDILYAVWCPTSGGYTFVNDYSIPLQSGAAEATLVEMAYGTTQGISSVLTAENGSVKVNVSETPILVFEGRVEDNAGPEWNDGGLTASEFTDNGDGTVTVRLSWPDAADADGVPYYTFFDAEGNVLIPENGAATVSNTTEALIQACNKAGGAVFTFAKDEDMTIQVYAYDYRGIPSAEALSYQYSAGEEPDPEPGEDEPYDPYIPSRPSDDEEITDPDTPETEQPGKAVVTQYSSRDGKGQWTQYEDGAWSFLVDGSPAAAWQQIDGVWYYFQDGGIMATGWQLINGTWYYLKDWGGMATGWQLINGTWYYLKDWGGMATGWQLINGTWYYLKDWGGMATGWQQIDGSWYYLQSWGGMLADAMTPDGYYVNSQGVWIA